MTINITSTFLAQTELSIFGNNTSVKKDTVFYQRFLFELGDNIYRGRTAK